MATTRFPACPKRPLVAVLISAAVLVGVPAGIAAANPPPSPDQVAAQIVALETQAEQATEAYNGAHLALEETQRRLEAAGTQVEGARQRRQATQAQLNRTIAAAYRVGASEQLLNLVTTDNPKIVLDRADSLARLGHDEGNQVAAAHTAERELSVAETAVAGELASARRLDADLAAKKAEVEATWRQQQQLLAQLQDDQLAALAAAQDRAEQAAAAGGRPGSAARPPQPGDASAPTGSAGTAVAAAYAQLGKPYRWGAAGPGAFDCSGLTQFVWGQAGRALPHYTGAQWSTGQRVPRGQERPGDLVFYGGDLHHMGIYVGNGQMIHAPHTGDVVRVAPAFRADYQGAVRP